MALAETDAPGAEPQVAGAPPERWSLTARIARNAMVQAGGTLASSVVAFLTFMAITRGLGPEAYGDFTAATVIVMIPVVITEMGMSISVVRDISSAPERTEHVMRASLPLRALIAVLAVVVTVAVGLILPFSGRTREAIIIGAVGAFLTLLNLAVLPVLQAQLRMHWAVAANLTGRVVTLVVTLAVLAAGLGFVAVVWASVIGIAATLVLNVVVVARTVSLRPLVDLPYWRTLLRDTVVVGLATGLGQVVARVDTVILALLVSAEEVGLYGAAYKFVDIAGVLLYAVGMSSFPAFSRMAAERSPRLREVTQRVFDVYLAASAPIVLLMLLYPGEILRWSAGSGYEDAAGALRLLAPSVAISLINGALWQLLFASRCESRLLGFVLALLTLNIALNVALIPVFGYKVAAITTIGTEAIGLALNLALVRYTHGFLPSVGFLPWVLVASAAMAGVALFLPVPALVGMALSLAVYSAIAIAVPGAPRSAAVHLLRAVRPHSGGAAAG